MLRGATARSEVLNIPVAVTNRYVLDAQSTAVALSRKFQPSSEALSLRIQARS